MIPNDRNHTDPGKILVAGNSSTNGWWVARLNSDGSIDNSGFGSPNGVETNFQTSGKCLTVTEENDTNHAGFVVLGGYTVSGTHQYAQLIRFNESGALDSGVHGFGSSGKLTLFNNSSWTNSYANYVEQAEFSPNDLIMGGQAYLSSQCGADFTLAGIATTGGVNDGLDTNFGTAHSGETEVNFGCSAFTHPIHGCSASGGPSYDADYSLVCWENGDGGAWSIYGVGVTNFTGSGNEFAIDRYTQSGAVDTTWSYNGVNVANTGAASTSGNSSAYVATLQEPNGLDYESVDQIIAAGTGTPNGTSNDFVVARFNLDGSLDSGFGSSGSIGTDLSYPGSNSYNFTTGYDVARGIAWDTTNQTIDVAGWSGPDATTGHLAVAEYIGNTVTIAAAPPPPYAPLDPVTLSARDAVGPAAVAPTDGLWGIDVLHWGHKRKAHPGTGVRAGP